MLGNMAIRLSQTHSQQGDSNDDQYPQQHSPGNAADEEEINARRWGRLYCCWKGRELEEPEDRKLEIRRQKIERLTLGGETPDPLSVFREPRVAIAVHPVCCLINLINN